MALFFESIATTYRGKPIGACTVTGIWLTSTLRLRAMSFATLLTLTFTRPAPPWAKAPETSTALAKAFSW